MPSTKLIHGLFIFTAVIFISACTTPIPYFDKDLSDYTPIFIDGDLIAIVNGDDWISNSDLYPYIYWEEESDEIAASANKSFLNNKDTLYIFNNDGLVSSYSNYIYDMFLSYSPSVVHLMLNLDQYRTFNPDFNRLCITTSNESISIATDVTVHKDKWKALYTLDINNDNVIERVTRENSIDNYCFTSEFRISNGEEDVVVSLNSYDLGNIVDGSYNLNDYKLISENSDFKAIFMDLNNDGVYEIITKESSYTFHTSLYMLYAFTENKWQVIDALYYDD